MDDPEWDGFVRERSPRVELGPKRPRRTRGPTLAACAALLLLCSMCLRSSWDGSGVLAMTAEEQRDALTVPPSMVSEEKRQAVVVRIQLELRERIAVLGAIAGEASPAGEAATRALESARGAIDAALPVPPEGR